jgi:hypothetical protein
MLLLTNFFIYYKFITLVDIARFPNQIIQMMCD